MSKQDFLEQLKEGLSGEVSPEVMMDSYRYYSNYIEEQIHSGKTEEQVLDSLGMPSLIARSIIAAKTGERNADVEYTEDGRRRKVRQREKMEVEQEPKTKPAAKPFVFDFGAWYAKLLYAVVFVLMVFVVYFILKLGFGILRLLMPLLVPVVLFLGIVYLILYFLQ